jgi:NADH-quinone oxidoreductase subunit M
MLLNLLVIAPFVAAILMVLNSRDDSNSSSRMAILMAAVFTAMSVALIVTGNQATTPIEWFHIPGTRGPVYYYLYAHGLGTWMVFLSCGLSLVALISARSTTGKNYRNFAIGIFALMGAMNGTFLAADAVLFFFFFEAMVIPAAILIAGFGGEKRTAAAMTFAIYTLVGSAPMMVALWYHCRQFPVAFHGGGYSEPPCGTPGTGALELLAGILGEDAYLPVPRLASYNILRSSCTSVGYPHGCHE